MLDPKSGKKIIRFRPIPFRAAAAAAALLAAGLAGCAPHGRSSRALTAPPTLAPGAPARALPASQPSPLPSALPSGAPSTTASPSPSDAPGERPVFPDDPASVGAQYGKRKPLPISAQKPIPRPAPLPEYTSPPQASPLPASAQKPAKLPPPSAQTTSPESFGGPRTVGDSGNRFGERSDERSGNEGVDDGFSPRSGERADSSGRDPRPASRGGTAPSTRTEPTGGAAPAPDPAVARASRGEAGRFAHRVLGESCARPATPMDSARDEAGERPLCLAVNYVVYRDGEGRPVQSAAQIARGLKHVNRIWARCGIAFQIERARAIDPERYGLREDTRDYAELSAIRKRLGDDERLLIVATGDWNRAGSIGSTGANAWTNLPGEGLYGAILERSVSANPQMLAHELGHYLGLGHRERPEDLMHPLISGESERLHASECADARETALREWRAMAR